MYTPVQIVNTGLSKIGEARIARLDPAQSALERFVASNYDHWRRSELMKRRWVFATEHNYALAKVDTLSGVDKPHKFALPATSLRPVRGKYDEWQQSGTHIFSANSALKITLVFDRSEAEFNPLFAEVLSARVALETVEYSTQSNTKKDFAQRQYDVAVQEAGRANAYVIGPEDVSSDDNDFPFVNARF